MSKGDRGGGRGRGRGTGSGRGRGRGRGRRGNSPNRPSNNNKNNNDGGYNGYGNVNGKSEQQSQQVQQRKPFRNAKKNGEKGADAHTVSESNRIKFTTILMEFREDDSKQRFEFPTNLTNTERKFLHQIAGQLGLTSKSTGKGENRSISVTKRDEKKRKTSNGDDESLPVLKIGKGGGIALSRHLSKFPPTQIELMESIETGSSLVEAMSQHKRLQQQSSTTAKNDNTASSSADDVLDVLDRLGLGGENSHNKEVSTRSRPSERRVDLSRRIARHADFQRMKRQERKKEYEQVLQNRSQLPAYERQAEIVATVGANPVTIIQGGKLCTV